MRRRVLWAGVALAIVGAVAGVSWTPPATWRFSDDRQRPAADAYVAFHYAGSLVNPVHSVTYRTGPVASVRADADGRVTIPAKVHLRRPLPLSTPPRLVVDYVYVPRLHHAFGPLTELTESHPGSFSVNHARSEVSVVDVSGDPVRWESALRVLLRFARETLESPAADGEVGRELSAHVRREYRALHERFGRERRRRPDMPDWVAPTDREKWVADIEAHLAREPLWGPYLERVWRDDLNALEQLERSRN